MVICITSVRVMESIVFVAIVAWNRLDDIVLNLVFMIYTLYTVLNY